MLTAVFTDDNGKIFNFKNVEKINIYGNDTIIGYYDDNGVYHEETGTTPKTIVINKEECQKIEESSTPSCETCKYKGFDVLFADSPCFGCVVTEGNFQSYEPKEN
jgi:hypothetical protein